MEEAEQNTVHQLLLMAQEMFTYLALRAVLQEYLTVVTKTQMEVVKLPF
ncbi:MAG: hypothetical protein LW688_03415 [Cryomorphaceae bacterium]|nr:hypothetical protein [Cryomorphaceae bacterium]